MSKYLVAIHIVELIAALAGTYYYLKTQNYQVKIFIWYLWLTVFVETLGMYGYILQNNYDNQLFVWLKNSVFCSNRWLYTTYSFVSMILFGKFYTRIIEDDFSIKIIKFSVIAYVVIAVFYFVFSGDFFVKSIPYDVFLETFLVFIFVMLYYRHILISDKILFFYKLPVFYLSSGLLLWYLCITPLYIFDGYHYAINKDFVMFRNSYNSIANILLYSCYTFGFLYTLQFRKQ